jgi:hypothetical protein
MENERRARVLAGRPHAVAVFAPEGVAIFAPQFKNTEEKGGNFRTFRTCPNRSYFPQNVVLEALFKRVTFSGILNISGVREEKRREEATPR